MSLLTQINNQIKIIKSKSFHQYQASPPAMPDKESLWHLVFFCLENLYSSIMFNTDNILNLAIAAFCTVATSAAVFYTTNYVIRDHHSKLKKRQFKQFAKQTREKISKIELEHIQCVKKLEIYEKSKQEVENTEADTDSTATDSTKYLEADETSIRLMEKLDSISPNSFLKSIDYEKVDYSVLDYLKREVEKLTNSRKQLIVKIQAFCDYIDQYKSD